MIDVREGEFGWSLKAMLPANAKLGHAPGQPLVVVVELPLTFGFYLGVQDETEEQLYKRLRLTAGAVALGAINMPLALATADHVVGE